MTPAAPPATRRPLYKSLFAQVVAGLILGVALGMAAPEFAISLKFFSDAFLKLISMIVAPIVFCVVVHGIAGAGDLKKVGRVGVKALVYFEAMTTVALAVGLIVAYLIRPGEGMNIDATKLDAHALSAYVDNARKLHGGGFSGFILNIIPSTAFDAFARNDVLQVLFFAIIFGVSLALVGEPAKPLAALIEIIGISLVTSKGAHGVPGLAIVILAATLNAVPSIPAIGLVLVLSIDWFVGMARALGNLVGNCVATVVIARVGTATWTSRSRRTFCPGRSRIDLATDTETVGRVGGLTVRGVQRSASLPQARQAPNQTALNLPSAASLTILRATR